MSNNDIDNAAQAHEKHILRKEVIAWLKAQISLKSKVEREHIDENQSFANYGLNSIDASNLVAKLSAVQKIRLPSHISYDHPTLYKLADYVADKILRLSVQQRIVVGNNDNVQPKSVYHGNGESNMGAHLDNISEVENKAEKVAILGVACNVPGAENIEAFWQNLDAEVDSITEIPESRWDVDALYAKKITPGKTATKWGGYLADVDQFDHHFFGISYHEASAMDPQQRVVLEQVWRAFEDAGIAQQDVAGTEVGVFLGVSNSDYAKLPYAKDANRGPYESTANAISILANRVSYLLDFQGPSVSIDTACSSSLVAIHQAARSVISGESSIAVAGGVNLILSPDITINFSQSKLMAPDGRCKTFDSSGNGYVRSEGAGIVILKRLDLAERDGDRILAVISGSATNNDGRSNGLTAPNGPAQERVISNALKTAGIQPDDIDYVEAHGTGTRLGDPIEVQALSHVFEGRSQPLIVGSVKTNIGHLESAAGVAGLIKTVMMLERRKLQPNLHFIHRNENIDWDDIPIEVCTKDKSWPNANKRLKAGVTSIGFGGVNSHVVLEEYPEGRLQARLQKNAQRRNAGLTDRSCHVLSISARSEAAIMNQLTKYRQYLRAIDESEFADFCFSANIGRTVFNHRITLVASSPVEMADAIQQQIDSGESNYYRDTVNPNRTLVMMFTGQGAVFPGMGEDLYRSNAIFKSCIDDAESKLSSLLDVPLSTLLWGEHSALLSNTQYAQPAIFVLEVALYEMITSWGIYPDTVMGHSVGEFAAAYAAGVIDLESGLKLTCARGKLMESLCQKGAMLALRTDVGRAEAIISGYDLLSVATHNSPGNTVIAGDATQLDELKSKLAAENIEFTALDVEHGFHSPLMAPMLDPFFEIAKDTSYQAPKLNFISSVTGQPLDPDVCFANYWRHHIHSKVDFYGALQAVPTPEQTLLMELGPKQVLRNLARQSQISFAGIVSAGAVGQQFWPAICDAVALLHSARNNVDWHSFEQGYCRTQVPVPHYVFDTVRCWNRKTATQTTSDLEVNDIHPDIADSDTIMVSQQLTESNQTTNEIYRILRASLAATLGGDASQIDNATPLTEYGVDSIALISIVHVINTQFGVTVEVRQLFEELNNLNSLASYILENSDYTVAQPAHSEVRSQPLVDNPQTQSQASAMPPSQVSTQQSPLRAESYEQQPQQQVNGHFNSASTGTGLEGIFNAQLQNMSRLLEAQLQVLAGNAVDTHQKAQHEASAQSQLTTGSGHAHQLTTSTQNVTESPTKNVGVAGNADRVRAYDNPIARTESANYTQPMNEQADKTQRAGQSIKPLKLNNEQNRELANLITRFNQKTQKSKQHAQEFRIPLADSRVAAKFQAETKELNYSLVCDRSKGAHFWDIDGNEYIDMSMSFSACFFGYNPPFITNAAKQALDAGIQLGPRTSDVGEVSRLLCELSGTERACFVSTGSEANMIAMRLARTVLKKKKVVIIRDIYHGQYDGTLATVNPIDEQLAVPSVPGITQGQVEDTIVMDIHDEQALNKIVARSHEIAAILVEPVLRRHLEVDISGLLKSLRAMATEHDIALIFDEVLLGFRCHPGGAQALYGIRADMVTYGKVVGGGFPIGVVAGSSRFLDATDGGYWQFGDQSRPEAQTTFVAGTHSKHPVSMAAAKAVMQRLKSAGLSLHEDLSHRLANFTDQLNQYFSRQGFPVSLVSWSSIFQIKCEDYPEIFACHLMENGVFYLYEGRLGAISTAHTDEDLSFVVAAFKCAANRMCEAGFWPGTVDNAHLDIRETFPAYPKASRTEESADNASQAAREKVRTSVGQLTVAEERLEAQSYVKPAVEAEFSISFFGAYERDYCDDKYDLLIDTARYADAKGYVGIWLPERHFHSFGGYSPNPSVLAAALARETQHMQLRAGSSVIPLHHPVRLAEEWAVVDNISNGRVGLAAASGWHPQDFIFAPDNFSENRQVMLDSLEKIQSLWQGGSLSCQGGDGKNVEANLYPMPKQECLPVWLTIVKNPETYYQAGKRGYGVLTNMMGQTPEELREHITHYQRGRMDAGLEPRQGKVAVLLHTYICQDEEQAKKQAERPFKDYLLTATNILDSMARSLGKNQEFGKLSPADQDFIIEKSYQRYLESAALIGSPDSCYKIACELKEVGVTEFSCFVDFGIDPDMVRQQLDNITELKNRFVIHDDSLSPIDVPDIDETQGVSLVTEESF